MADTLYKLLLHTYMYLSTYLGTYSYIGTIEVLKEKKIWVTYLLVLHVLSELVNIS